MATKISELNATTSVAGEDLLITVVNPANTSSIESKKITVNNLFGSLGVSGSNGVSASVSGNSITISLDVPGTKTITVSNEKIASQSNTAPYSNTVTTINSTANATTNAATVEYNLSGSLVGNVALNSNGIQVISIGTNEAVLQNPSFNTVRVLKLNFTTAATPANSSYVNSSFEYVQGDTFYDADNLYIAVSNTEIKKVALSAIT